MPKKKPKAKAKRGKAKRQQNKGNKAVAKSTTGAKSQVLSPKFKNVFQQMLKFYDSRDYKHALKQANSILKSVSNHGETLAMKGLIVYKMEPAKNVSEEQHGKDGEALIKEGIKNNPTSYVCWHVYGLFYRAQRKYSLAMRTYKNAHRLKSEDFTILRDLCYLQAQQRDWPGYLTSAAKALQLRSTLSSSWMSFVIAHYMNKNYDVALEALSAYRKTLPEAKLKKYDHSELCYLESEIIIAKGDYAGALAQLDQQKAYMRDQVRFRERKALIQMNLKQFDAAAETYITLFQLNPENYNYHRGFQSALLQNTDHLSIDNGLDLPVHHLSISEEQRTLLQEKYAYLRRHQPRCSAHKHIEVSIASADHFKDAVTPIVNAGVAKAKPGPIKITSNAAKLALASGPKLCSK